MSSSPPLRTVADRPPTRDMLLVRRIARGESRALSELYDRYSGSLLALARRILNDSAEAEELLQEVFLQVWREAGRYNPDRCSVPTWLVLNTRRLAIRRLRWRCVGGRAVSTARREEPARRRIRQKRENVVVLERRSRVAQELKALPREQRQTLELAFYEGLTLREISERTQVSLRTSKARAQLAMERLRHALKSDIERLP